MRKIWKDKRGTTLVEILVVMVVLLVGIMTIVQMFPTGFRLVRAGESESIASRLARQELERWKASAANLPDAIVPVGEVLGSHVVFDNQVPLSPFTGWYEDPDNPGQFLRGNAFNIRRILGETTDVPAPSYFGTGGGTQFGSRYTLAFSPIQVSYSGGNLVGLYIKGADMKRNTAPAGQYQNLKPGNYAIDYNVANGQTEFSMWFPADNAQKRTYYVSYSYWKSGTAEPEMVTVVNQQINLPDGNWNGGWHSVPLPGGAAMEALEESSDTCARGFIEQPGDFTSDPYEFRLADPIMGVIAFNPAGHGAYEYTATGPRPLKARIDYRRYDPRIMREDKVVPRPTGNDDIPMKMSLRFILNSEAPGDPTDNPNEAVYKGLAKLPMNPTPTFELPLPVYIVDLATGLQVEMPPVYLRSVQNGGKLDYSAGIIYLPQRANLVSFQATVEEKMVELKGRHLRFFYRADGDWSVQCHKACTVYSRVYDTAAVTYNTFTLADRGNGVYALVFAPCQAEQTVSVDFTYGPPAKSGEMVGEKRVVGYSGQIQMDYSSSSWMVALPKLPADSVIKRISVVGTSVRARVLWRDGKYWRSVDLDTTITK